MLTGSVFMLDVYYGVLPSRSLPNLIGLCVIAAFLFGMLTIIDTSDRASWSGSASASTTR